MDLIPLETGGGEDLGPRQIRISETAKQLARIQSSPVRRAFAEAEIRMVGKIAYDETKVKYITSWVPGRLDRLYADFTGIRVKKGDHMVYIYSPELLATQEELLQAKKAVDALGKTKSRILKKTAGETFDAAREKLKLYGLTEDQIKKIETTNKTSDHLTINAPIGGIVVHKNAKEGMYVQTGTQIYTIADLSKLWIYFEAYESDLPWLRYGQSVQFTSPSFPGEQFEAIISFIDPIVDPKKRTVKVRAIVDNNDNLLKPNMFVSGVVKSKLDNKGKVIDKNLAGKLMCPMHPEVVKDSPGSCDVCGMPLVKAEELGYSTQTASDVNAPLVIPSTAPMITGKRAVVYVEIPDDDGTVFEGREVELGPRAGDFYVVKSGLEEGERVVINGTFKIDSELQIQAKPSMMSPEGGGGPVGHQHGTQTASSTDRIRHKTEGKKIGKYSISTDALEALTPLYESYFEIQMALANDDLDASVKGYKKLPLRAKEVDMSLFEGDARMAWMEFANDISTASNKGNTSSLEETRQSFLSVSKAIVRLESTFGHGDGKTYYLIFCSMANDNKGVHWLQDVDTVYNPFYGESMLRCGEIKKTLAPVNPVNRGTHVK
jgi:Cu(I)/Ag(I) efflux system membrane fusion protein